MGGREQQQAGQHNSAALVGLEGPGNGAEADDIADRANQHEFFAAEGVDDRCRRHREDQTDQDRGGP